MNRRTLLKALPLGCLSFIIPWWRQKKKVVPQCPPAQPAPGIPVEVPDKPKTKILMLAVSPGHEVMTMKPDGQYWWKPVEELQVGDKVLWEGWPVSVTTAIGLPCEVA